MDRCLYGVDKNPMAVEMAKLSMWLITMKRNEPFTFLDHTLKCGDSLLGLTSPEQIEKFHIFPEQGTFYDQFFRYSDVCVPALKDALGLRKQMKDYYVYSASDFEDKERIHRRAQTALQKVKQIADLILSVAMSTADKSRKEQDKELHKAGALLKKAFTSEKSGMLLWLENYINENMNSGNPNPKVPRKTFHWVLEFPEIFANMNGNGKPGGFDAIVGNPPFQGGQKITGTLGTDYRNYLLEYIANGRRGSADLCSYFFLRVMDLLAENGMMGYLATNTIAQGDTREVGLDQITEQG